MNDAIVIAHLTNGTARYVAAQDILRYSNGRPIACGDLRLRQRKHLAAGFDVSIDAEDWVNDAHNKPEFMRAKGVAFFSVAYRA